MSDSSLADDGSDVRAETHPLEALALRCEREKPSRELDAAIVIALDIRPEWCREVKGHLWIDKKRAINGEPPIRLNSLGGRNSPGNPPIGHYLSYTSSLDATVTLVPKHRSYELTFSAAGVGALRRARLWDWRRSATGLDPGNEWLATGKTLPLALCAASIRARAALSSEGEEG